MKKNTKIIIILLLIIFVVLNKNVPSEEDLYVWLSREYGIRAIDYSMDIEEPDYRRGMYELDGDKIQEMSSHIKTVGLFMTVEKNFRYDDGTELTIRRLGILNRFYPVKDNKAWKILN